jgi:hypothetical protein
MVCMFQYFSPQVVSPVHTHNNRTVPNLVVEPEDPVMLVDMIFNITLGALYTYAYYIVQ